MPVESPDDLYGLPLERFIPERAALARALRGEKRRDEAKEVAALRKPSVAAWAVNQLVRTQGQELNSLFKAGDDLVAAQSAAAEGKRAGDAMRDATRRQREAVSRLVQAAEGLLSSDGHPLSQTTLERVGDTLRAAAVDPDARERVESGCLAHELRFVGLGVGDVSTAPSRPAKAGSAGTGTKRSAQEGETKQQKAPQGERAANDARAEAEAKRQKAEAERQRKAGLKAARRAKTDARRAATRAEKELTAAQARREEAAAALDEAERLLTAAEASAQQATAQLRNAEQAVTELEPPRR